MKKFLIAFLVLVILAGLGLFFGWAQLGVPPDSYGIIRSKSHGMYPQLVKPGEFKWIWYKLIPTNVATSVFRLSPVSRSFFAKNTLPSGQVYSAFASIESDFSWEINGALSFSLKPESLLKIIGTDNIATQEELAEYQDNIAGQIELLILRRMDFVEELLENGESPELEREIQREFPLITNISLSVTSARLPDFILYNEIKSLYENYIAVQKEYLAGDFRENAQNRVESYFRLGELEQYGALLTKYPILLEYLALENGKNQ